MDHNTLHTKTVDKAEARLPRVFLSFVLLGLFTLFIIYALGSGIFADAWPDMTKGENKTPFEDLRNYFWSVGMVAAGLAALWGFALAAVRTHALDRQAKTAEHDSALNAKKHDTETFATAIEQLGHDKFAVRLGAVYALEALAKTSKSLHGPIFETLCAYIREEAPSLKNPNTENISKPDVVVQAILTVIGRRIAKHDPENYQIDLQDTHLRNARLKRGNYKKANFTRSDLKGANLHLAQLEGAFLFSTNLKEVYLKGVTFDKETFVYNANFRSAHQIPAQNGNDFRATVQNSEDSKWPTDNDLFAWDRGDEDDT
ncbi:MAG: hypothetical protein COB46_10290 [Rhodospirillaceae bacterium]|nr:MAG: hypothetical protein COB46_10290 [Rhodospirillaceae bacterium]